MSPLGPSTNESWGDISLAIELQKQSFLTSHTSMVFFVENFQWKTNFGSIGKLEIREQKQILAYITAMFY